MKMSEKANVPPSGDKNGGRGKKHNKKENNMAAPLTPPKKATKGKKSLRIRQNFRRPKDLSRKWERRGHLLTNC